MKGEILVNTSTPTDFIASPESNPQWTFLSDEQRIEYIGKYLQHVWQAEEEAGRIAKEKEKLGDAVLWEATEGPDRYDLPGEVQESMRCEMLLYYNSMNAHLAIEQAFHIQYRYWEWEMKKLQMISIHAPRKGSDKQS
jgi:hypothetical protein